MRLFVEDRWRGDHGISRFAREVLSRSNLRYEPLGASGNPASPLDPLRLKRIRLPREGVLVNPGFNAGPSRAIQLLTIHDLIHLEGDAGLRRHYYERFVRPAVRNAGRVLTVSETSKSAIVRWLNDDSIEVCVVGNGVDAAFSAARRSTPRLPEGDSYVLYVGNMKAHKNAPVAFQAVADAPRVRLVCVTGDRASAEALASQYGVAGRTRIVSEISDRELISLYANSDALLFPSVAEGFGLPVLEALAAGCPVLHLTDCAAVSEISSHFDSGLTALPAEREAWSEALRAHLTSSVRVSEIPDFYRWETVSRRWDFEVGRQWEGESSVAS